MSIRQCNMTYQLSLVGRKALNPFLQLVHRHLWFTSGSQAGARGSVAAGPSMSTSTLVFQHKHMGR